MTALTPGRQLAFSLPAVATGLAFMLFMVYAQKFSTDVLGIAPAFLGIVFAASRVCDALTDPLVGHLSDRTRNRFGRRRIWMAASVVPLAFSLWMLWATPAGTPSPWVEIWVGTAALAFLTIATGLTVPHLALGVQFRRGPEDRNKVFGLYQGGIHVGALLGIVAVGAILASAEPRVAARHVTAIVAVVVVILVVLALPGLREEPRSRDSSATGPLRDLASIAGSARARRLLFVVFVTSLVSGTDTQLTLYYADYVLGDERVATWLLLAAIVAIAISATAWPRLPTRASKRKTLVYALIGDGLAHLCLLLPGTGAFAGAVVAFAGAGLCTGVSATYVQSMLADLVDEDREQTGREREATWFATAQVARKLALGGSYLIVGLALQFSGFVANAPEAGGAQLTIRLLVSVVPVLMLLAGVAVLGRPVR